jgi:hypothetical protein
LPNIAVYYERVRARPAAAAHFTAATP